MDLPLPPSTRYDLTARHLFLRAGALLLSWLLRLTPLQVRFERWLPTALTLPGVPERLCDGIAELIDLRNGGVPCAGILEVQTTPDATMTGRLLLAGGLLWLTVKPTPLPGDRYLLVGLVINLTGTGDASHRCAVGTGEWLLQPVEVNLETLAAGAVLDEIEAGSAPRELLALIPLLQAGDEPAIIERWKGIVGAETDLSRRGDYGLARIFAERVNRGDAWRNAMEGLTMMESPIIAELLADRERTSKTTLLLGVLDKRYGEIPDEVKKAVRSCTDAAKLDRCFYAVIDADTVEIFRQQTGL